MKFLRFFLIIFFFANISNVAHPLGGGSGPLKFSSDTFDWFLAYMRGDGNPRGEVGRKKGTPGMFAVNKEGTYSFYYYCPIKFSGNCIFGTEVIHDCTKQSKKRGYGRCYLFAKQRKIVWDGKNIRLPRKFDEAYIESVLKENGWYGNSKSASNKSSKSNNPDKTKQKKLTKNNDTVDQLKKLNDLYKSGVLSEEEFIKAKKKILN